MTEGLMLSKWTAKQEVENEVMDTAFDSYQKSSGAVAQSIEPPSKGSSLVQLHRQFSSNLSCGIRWWENPSHAIGTKCAVGENIEENIKALKYIGTF